MEILSPSQKWEDLPVVNFVLLLLQAMTKDQEATVYFWLNGVILLEFPKSKDAAFYRWKALTVVYVQYIK